MNTQKPQTLEELLQKFEKKVNELRREQIPDKVHEFGYKALVDNELFTVVDWAHIKAFLKKVYEAGVDQGITYQKRIEALESTVTKINSI